MLSFDPKTNTPGTEPRPATETQNGINTSPLGLLPVELLSHIFSFLPSKDIASLGETCVTLNDVSKHNQIWKPLFRRLFPLAGAAEANNGYLDLCKESTLLRHNVEMGTPQRQDIQRWPRDESARHRLQVTGDRIVRQSAADLTIIDIYDKKTGKCLKNLEGHTSRITCLEVAGEFIFTGSEDRSIRIWDIKTGKCLHVLRHKDPILCIHVAGDHLYTGSFDKTTMISTIKIWNKKTGECLQTIKEHGGGISCLQVSGNRLCANLSADLYNYRKMPDETAIGIWDLESGQCLHILKTEDQEAVTHLQTNREGEIVFTGSFDGMIRAWNIESGEFMGMVTEHEGSITGLQIVGDRLFTSSSDKTIKICDVDIGEDLHTLQHGAVVDRLQAAGNYLVTGSKKMMKIWDKETGKCLQTLTEKYRSNQLQVAGSHLITEHEIWDFGVPSPSSYSLRLLEGNLEILGKMAHHEFNKEDEAVEELSKQLYPDFQKRLEEYRSLIGASSPLCKEAILHVQAEVCVEVLLHALYRGDSIRVNQILEHLQFINREHTNKLYGLLWSECGKPNAAQWGENAFHNRPGYSASVSSKIEAVKKLRDLLKQS